MILSNGTLYETAEQNRLLDGLEQQINATRASLALDSETVIRAVGILRRRVLEGAFRNQIADFLTDSPEHYIRLAADFMDADSLRYRMAREFGQNFAAEEHITPPYGVDGATVRFLPLGTLFHIAAGNMDGLPAFSVLEGLLTGNVNILKLPQADNGLTVEIFRHLIEIEPTLAPFIHVFDTPSSDVAAMKRMAEMSDGIVVWGGDSAVSAVRALAPTGAKLIEWGHKLGFAYLSGYERKEAELTALAEHILESRQLLCSSCQTIYLDTEDMGEVCDFCRDFLPYLDAAAEKYPIREVGAVAELTLRRYTERLERALGGQSARDGRETFQGRAVSLTACADSELELSYMYGNPLVKPLPQKALLPTLRRAKGTLQTAGLICLPDRRAALTDLLARAGVTRIMRAGHMSITFCGEAHDGEYPLRRYMRVVNIED